MRALSPWLAALWWGSLTTLGFLVVPLLFVYLPSPAMAGGMAARLFAAQAFVSILCGILLSLFLTLEWRVAQLKIPKAAFLLVLAGTLLAILLQFGVAPRIVARDNIVVWHRAGSVLYLLQWLCATIAFGQLASPSTRAATPP